MFQFGYVFIWYPTESTTRRFRNGRLKLIKLDILSDPICPWCLIGKANLDRALLANPDHPFVIEWHPFQLNPEMPAQGMDRRVYLETKFGGQDGAIKVYSQIDQAAKDVGLNINWDGITRTPNTFNAHRLIHWAGIDGRQTEVVDAVFDRFFMRGQDIGEIEVLLNIAADCELDRDAFSRLLDSDIDSSDLQAREAHSRKMGVNSVPTFIIANQSVLPGAQSTELWTSVINDLINQPATT